MLIDDLVARGAPGSGCDIGCLYPAMRAAQKFTLSPEFAAVADALSTDYTGLVKAFPFCRLPFKATWIEVSQADRRTFSSAGIQAPMFQIAPHRVGYLLTATRDDLSAWKAHLFWSFHNGGASCPAMAMDFDMTRSLGGWDGRLPMLDAKEHSRRSLVLEQLENHPGWEAASDTVKATMVAHVRPSLADYGGPVVPGIPPEMVAEIAEALVDLSRSDWAGEPAYLLAVIGLLNARNAVETETVDKAEQNRKRAKRDRPPMFSHKVLKIAGRQRKRVYGDGAEDHARMRGHFVRGHWKVRATGIYFWHPHARGDFALGRVEKEYQL